MSKVPTKRTCLIELKIHKLTSEFHVEPSLAHTGDTSISKETV